jgi:hypothetical protein
VRVERDILTVAALIFSVFVSFEVSAGTSSLAYPCADLSRTDLFIRDSSLAVKSSIADESLLEEELLYAPVLDTTDVDGSIGRDFLSRLDLVLHSYASDLDLYEDILDHSHIPKPSRHAHLASGFPFGVSSFGYSSLSAFFQGNQSGLSIPSYFSLAFSDRDFDLLVRDLDRAYSWLRLSGYHSWRQGYVRRIFCCKHFPLCFIYNLSFPSFSSGTFLFIFFIFFLFCPSCILIGIFPSDCPITFCPRYFLFSRAGQIRNFLTFERVK